MQALVEGFSSTWFHFTTPPEPPPTAPLWQREVVRRARIISIIMLISIWLALFPNLFAPSIPIIIGTLSASTINFLGLITFNRYGKIIISGLILSFTTNISIIMGILQQLQGHNGLTLTFLPALFIPVQAIAISTASLRPRLALLVLLLNCAVIFGIAFFAPRSPEMNIYFQTSEGIQHLILVPLESFMATFLAIVIWVNSANNAIIRADDADARANYAEQMATYDREARLQKEILERDVNEIITVIAKISQDSSQEVTVSHENQLRSISIALNNLRKRQSRNQFEVQIYQKTEFASQALIHWLDADRPLSRWEQSGTILDDVTYHIHMRDQRMLAQLKTGYFRQEKSQPGWQTFNTEN